MLRRLPPTTRRALTVRIVGPRAILLDRLDIRLASPEPSAVLVTGLAGGCGPDLRPGDVLVGDPVAIPGAESCGEGGDPASAAGRFVRSTPPGSATG